ncbi:hypothetical protein [Chryseobacterium sp.]|jgi:predicted lipid-binding transport protein (Tim44 family)|uniref:hypothetical protein n=1 Tax=Chryseobacterium sp. TaxID=1871047 RepID=UPI00284CB1EC|nr:hypothetical protein [Chryseobacterium sp.]MDR3026060.1 hypothetical protein [Chryseobacterium sp.]
MEYAVGIYKIVPPKPFPSFEQAVEYIQEKYPELDVKTIEKHLTPKIINNAPDQSRYISEENSAVDKGSSKADTKSIKGVELDIDKSRKPNKG